MRQVAEQHVRQIAEHDRPERYRHLLGAGAQRLLSVNWEIDDHTAFEMFTEMYSQLPTTSIGEALHNAQEVIRARNPHPYYWSGFSLTGTWRAPIMSKNSPFR